MKKFLLTRLVITIVFGLNYSTVDVPIVTVGQDSHPIPMDAEYEALINYRLSNLTTGLSLRSSCLRIYECLSFDEIFFEDVSDVNFDGVRKGFSSEALESGTDAQLRPAS
jgi:hypothetical protein